MSDPVSDAFPPSSRAGDAAWQAAVGWVMREHDGSLDEAGVRALQAWLDADSRHHAAYLRATELWLAVGFLPADDERG